MLCLSPNDKKWTSEYNKRLNNCCESDFQIISYDISENHKIFNELWTLELKLLNVFDNKIKSDIYDIHINFDGSISCNCKDYIFRCKSNGLPCKHIIHIMNCICDKQYDEIKYCFQKKKYLTEFDINNIKLKLQQKNYCLLCCETINEKNYLDKYMFETMVNHFKSKCTKSVFCDCHNNCLTKLYEYVNK